MLKHLLYAAIVFIFSLSCGAQINITVNRYDNNRSAANPNETLLTASNVNSASFGKLWSYSVQGTIFAQPLYVQNVSIAGGTHNVLFVATMHNLVYAFDADSNGSPLWTANLGPTGNGSAFSTPLVPSTDSSLGVLSTPVIDLSSSIMYVVAANTQNGSNVYSLHALDIRTGNDAKAPVTITATIAGQSIDPAHNIQRAGLTLAGGKVLIAFSGNPLDTQPYHGWIVSYDKNTLAQQGVFTTSQGAANGASIWQSGGAPPVDAAGNVYYLTGNGFTNGFNGVTNFAETLLQMSSSGAPGIAWQPAAFFTPANWAVLDQSDLDLSCNAPMLIPGTSLVAFGSKNANIYVAQTDSLKGIEPNGGQPHQLFQVGPLSFTSPATGYPGILIGSAPAMAAFNNKLYIAFQSNDSSHTLFVTSSSDGVNFTTPAVGYSGIQIGSAPAMAVFNNKLYIAFQANDSSHTLFVTSSSDGVNFTTPAVGYSGIQIGSAPAMAAFNSKLYIAFQANDSSHTLFVASSSDGVNFTTPAVGHSGILIGSAPAMAAFNSKLYISFQANDSSHTLFVTSSSDGVNFTTPATGYPGILIGTAPAMAALNGILYIAFQANDSSRQLFVTSSTDGVNFTTPAIGYPGILIGNAPAMTSFNSTLYAAFQSNDSGHALFVTPSSVSGNTQAFNDGNRIIGLAYRDRHANGSSMLYAWPGFGTLTAVPFDATNGSFNSTAVLLGPIAANGEPSVALSLSANGDMPGTAVLWATKTTQGRSVGVPGTLFAFNGETLQQLWNSDMNSTDSLGNLAKFVIPVVANGHVYVATNSNTVSVYGLK